MNSKIAELFYISEQQNEFDAVDRLLSREIIQLLRPYQDQMAASEYERLRDILFSVSQMAKKYSFNVGFQVAFEIITDCTGQR